MPETNAFIERANQDVVNGVRTNLQQAGLPNFFKKFAGECYCVLRNTHVDAEGSSPWKLTHGIDFHGQRIPFGAKVYFKAAPPHKSAQPQKEEAQAQVGIFGGYEIDRGYTWNGLYRVWYLDDFTHVNLAREARVDENL